MLRPLLNRLTLDIESDGNELCEACIMGKQHRLSFGQRVSKPENPGEQVSADICGPMPVQSLGGARYFACFKDTFSNFRAVYILKEKSQVSNCAKYFLSKAKIQGHSKEILTDGEKEFVNKIFKELETECGMYHSHYAIFP